MCNRKKAYGGKRKIDEDVKNCRKMEVGRKKTDDGYQRKEYFGLRTPDFGLFK
jgi:hypothetical protein